MPLSFLPRMKLQWLIICPVWRVGVKAKACSVEYERDDYRTTFASRSIKGFQFVDAPFGL